VNTVLRSTQPEWVRGKGSTSHCGRLDFQGRPSPREAYRVGLVQEVVAPGAQVQRAMEIAEIIASNAPLGIQVTKEAGRKFIEAGEQAAIAVVPTIRERVMGTEDAAEGIRSFVERRPASFQGR